ncbi:uncharacterized protein LOC126553034 [Aphis gossypii]|uniref:uncharacterized protein LOC126553034 n=1 Tax=Aphis gossypii TaxID=80765 RepID=UPI002158B308|nr:uncharacterized protein LOC126553034 [Aphis gossypii]
MWTLIHLYEPPDAKTPDLIPNAWIIDNDTCWYPMSFRLSKIKSLAREKVKPNTDDWEKFKIEIVESNIDNYDYGIKLMYKLLKNKSKKNLHSDAELKGRGMRKKDYLQINTSTPFDNHQLIDVDFETPHIALHNNSDFMKFKSNMNYLKLELTSFIENKEASTLQNNTFNQEKTDDVLSTFPINDEEKLLTLESKLASYDLGYNDKLLSAFMFASEGKSISKVTNSLLKTIFTDKFASAYSWKGQKEKKKLENYKIFKVIINCVGIKFPNSANYKMDVIASVMNWFAQAPTRILRYASHRLQPSSFDEDDTT